MKVDKRERSNKKGEKQIGTERHKPFGWTQRLTKQKIMKNRNLRFAKIVLRCNVTERGKNPVHVTCIYAKEIVEVACLSRFKDKTKYILEEVGKVDKREKRYYQTQ